MNAFKNTNRWQNKKRKKRALNKKRKNLYVNNDDDCIVKLYVAPCLSSAPASDSSSSGFVSGRGTTVRSGLNGVLGHRIPSRTIESGVRSNASGAPLSTVTTCSMVRARTTLSAV